PGRSARAGLCWWRLPLPDASEMLPHRTLSTLWTAPLWGGAAERGLALVLLGSALVGGVVLHRLRRRPAARLLFVGAGVLLTLAFLGIAWGPLGQLGTSALFAP